MDGQISNQNMRETGINASFDFSPAGVLGREPVVWAIDAFPDQLGLHAKTASVLREMFPQSEIHPVYVLSEEAFTDRGFTAFLKPALKPMALKAINSLLEETQCFDFRKPRVLTEASASRTACARKLLRYTKKIGAGHIVLGSHARRSLSRFLVGSFSEEILDHSPVPIIIAGPQTQLISAPPTAVIFATDFTPSCASGFTQILNLAASLNADLHLFHKGDPDDIELEPVNTIGMDMFGSGWVSLESYIDQHTSDYRYDADECVRRAEELGVTTRLILQNFREPTAEAIVEYARNLDDPSALIAMVSQTGPVASAFLGSVTRDVIRTSPFPVYLAPRI